MESSISDLKIEPIGPLVGDNLIETDESSITVNAPVRISTRDGSPLHDVLSSVSVEPTGVGDYYVAIRVHADAPTE